MDQLIRLRTAVFGSPLAIHPVKLQVILDAIGDRLGLDASTEAIQDIEGARFSKPSEQREYVITQDGIAIIPVQGSLMKRTSGLNALSGLTSYDGIAANLKDAIASPDVKGVLFDIDSPGGTTSGLFELCDLIYSTRKNKPIYAVTNDSAFSAAYAIASSAERLFLSRTAGVGSIGVFALHLDQQKADQKAGLQYTYVYKGERKVDGNSHEPLTDSARADMQAEVDRQYQMFVALVARNRSKNAQAITATEAACYFGDNAIPLLADQIGTFEDALQALRERITGVKSQAAHSVAIGAQAPTLNTNVMELSPNMEEILAKHTTEQADEELAEKECADALKDAEDGEPEDEEDGDQDEKKKKEDDDEEEEEEATKANASAIRIVNLCTLAGVPEMAASYLTDGLTVKQVEKALLKQRASKSSTTKVSTMLTVNTKAFDRIAAGYKANANYETFLKTNANLYQAYLDERDSADPRQYVAALTQTLQSKRV